MSRTGEIQLSAITIANLFVLPTYRGGGIADLGRTREGWLDARPHLVSGLDDCDGVLLAYGTQEPSGEARTHHRDQVRLSRPLHSVRTFCESSVSI